jgi:phosphomannomutase
LKCSGLRKLYPGYVISKKKLKLDQNTDIDKIFESVKIYFKESKIDERDGLKIENEKGWVQIRKSNTEPIIRIYAEGGNSAEAENLADLVIKIVKNL